MKKIYVIAGEASGDLHGANLMRSLLKKNKQLDFRYWGGDQMQKVYGAPVKHISELAFMGFIEVVANLRTILKNIRFCKEDIENYQPDALILVDYPGFNLRIAKWAKSKGIPVIYYISPQVWAWKQSRVHKIKKVVDKLMVILPFEKEFFARFDIEAEYVGHPLLDAIEQYQEKIDLQDVREKYQLNEKPVIALLPGSRKQEINTKLPIMLESVKGFDDYQFVVAMAPSLSMEFYQNFTKNYTGVQLVQDGTYDVLSIASAALVTSGTATLETALFKVPEVVCYIGSSISYHIAKRLIKVDYISLVNLILNKEAVKELIQRKCNPEQIQNELRKVLPSGENHKKVMGDYENLIQLLGKGGASDKAAAVVLQFLEE